MIAAVDFDVIPAGMEVSKPLPPFIEATKTGLILAKDLTFEEWSAIGASFGSALQTAAWCIGDWLVYGEMKWGKQLGLNGGGFEDLPSNKISMDSYNVAIRSTGMDLSTLKSYASICRSIPRAEREEKLTFGHHASLASLKKEKRLEWLEVVTSQPSVPSVKRLRLSMRIAEEKPRIVTDEEIVQRGEQAGHDNYVPHLTRLLTVLRKTVPGMSHAQRQALREDAEQLMDLLNEL